MAPSTTIRLRNDHIPVVRRTEKPVWTSGQASELNDMVSLLHRTKEIMASYAGAGFSCGEIGAGRALLADAGIIFSGFVSVLGIWRSFKARPEISK